MKAVQALLLVGSCIIFSSAIAVTQSDYVSTGLSAYDVPVDARSIAMGESFVALTGNHNALMYNPAGLGAIRGAQLSYSRRNFNWTKYLEDFKYHQVNGTLQTPFVNFGFSYNRENQGEVEISTEESPDRNLGKAEFYNYALAFVLGKRLGSNWDIGIALKTFDLGWKRLSGTVPDLQTSRPFLVDFGCIYSNQITTAIQSISQSYSVGFALQNIGGKLKFNSPYLTQEVTNNEESLPQYIRIGLTYCLAVQGLTDQSLQSFSVLVTGEYRTFTNGSDRQSGQKDFWGFGIELKAMEIVSLRLAGFINPYRSVYGMKGNPALRYGFGVSIPFQKLGVELPIVVQFDYAGIPPQVSNSLIGAGEPKTMRSFSFSLVYENELF